MNSADDVATQRVRDYYADSPKKQPIFRHFMDHIVVGTNLFTQVSFLRPLGLAVFYQLFADAVLLLVSLYLSHSSFGCWDVVENAGHIIGCVILELLVCGNWSSCGSTRQGVCHYEALSWDVRHRELIPHHLEAKTLDSQGEFVQTFPWIKERDEWFVVCLYM